MDEIALADWPEQRDAKAFTVGDGRVSKCGRCNGTLQHVNQNRCPYIGCRAYLRGRHELHDYKRRPGLDHS